MSRDTRRRRYASLFGCLICGGEFAASRRDAIMCGPRCRKRFTRHADRTKVSFDCRMFRQVFVDTKIGVGEFMMSQDSKQNLIGLLHQAETWLKACNGGLRTSSREVA